MRIAGLALAGLLLAACSSRAPAAEVGDFRSTGDDMNAASPAGAEDLRFSAVASVDSADPALIHARVTITNRAREWRRVEFAACRGRSSLRLRLYRSKERNDAPVWDSDAAWAGTFCKGVGALMRLGPDESASPDEWALDEHVPAEVPPGTYYASVSLRLSPTSVDLPVGAVTLPPGPARTPPPDPRRAPADPRAPR